MSLASVHSRVRQNLESFWSPEQIACGMKLDGLASGEFVSRSMDRKSGLLTLSRVKNLRSKTVITKMREQVRGISERLRRTMTLDNGIEFAQHAKMIGLLPMDSTSPK